MFHPFLLVSEYFCVGYIFLLVFQVQVSADILIVIAVDRWRKICHPFQWQLSYKMSKGLCVAAILFGVIEALPSFWLYGSHTVHILEYNITGEECSIKDAARETIYPVLYVTFFWILTFIRTTVLSVLYCKIMITVKRHDKVIQTKLNKYKTEGGSLISKSEAFTDTADQCKDTEIVSGLSKFSTKNDFEKYQAQMSLDCTDDIHGSLKSLHISTNDFGGQEKAIQDATDATEDSNEVNIDYGCITKESKTDNGKTITSIPDQNITARDPKVCHVVSKDSRRSRTVTIIMFTVTVTCMVIYIPYLILATLRVGVMEYECLLSHGERVIYKIFIRSYYMKAIINPLVYGIFDPRFRSALGNIVERRQRRQTL